MAGAFGQRSWAGCSPESLLSVSRRHHDVRGWEQLLRHGWELGREPEESKAWDRKGRLGHEGRVLLCNHGNGHYEDCGKMESVCNTLLRRKYRLHNATCTITTMDKCACGQRPKGTPKVTTVVLVRQECKIDMFDFSLNGVMRNVLT